MWAVWLLLGTAVAAAALTQWLGEPRLLRAGQMHLLQFTLVLFFHQEGQSGGLAPFIVDGGLLMVCFLVYQNTKDRLYGGFVILLILRMVTHSLKPYMDPSAYAWIINPLFSCLCMLTIYECLRSHYSKDKVRQ